MILSLDHVQLAIPKHGEAEARRFFVELLGMREVPKPPELLPSGCWFEGGSVKLHLGVDPDFRPARKAHPALIVDDLDGLYERLATAGHTVEQAKQLAGYKRFFASDPFGNRIEFMQIV